jgi:hypothetical protein
MAINNNIFCILNDLLALYIRNFSSLFKSIIDCFNWVPHIMNNHIHKSSLSFNVLFHFFNLFNINADSWIQSKIWCQSIKKFLFIFITNFYFLTSHHLRVCFLTRIIRTKLILNFFWEAILSFCVKFRIRPLEWLYLIWIFNC